MQNQLRNKSYGLSYYTIYKLSSTGGKRREGPIYSVAAIRSPFKKTSFGLDSALDIPTHLSGSANLKCLTSPCYQ